MSGRRDRITGLETRVSWPWWRSVMAILLIMLAGGLAQAGQDQIQAAIAKNTNQLQELRDEITANKNKISNLDTQEAEVVRGQDKIQKDIELSRKLLLQMEERERTLTARTQLLQQELQTNNQAFAGRRETLAASLRAMYMRGDRSDLEGILTAGSFSDLVTRLKMQRMLARLQAGLVDETRSQAHTIVADKKQQEAALAEIARSRQDMDQENDRLEMLLAEQQAALRDLKTQRRGLKDHMLELSMNEQKLTYVLADLEQQRKGRPGAEVVRAGSLGEMAGKMEWPVRGTLVRGFGRSVHPEFKTVTQNNGVNIAAPQGSPVAAVAAGRVEFLDQLPGFGQCVILDHGQGYYSLYAYLDHVFVSVGANIAQGQVIAEVGRPSAQEDPQLYFEIRKGRTPLDPGDWLRPR